MATTLRTPRLFTVSEYYAMVRAGVLHENDRVELIRGQIIPMSPTGSRHANSVRRLDRLFQRRVDPEALVSAQNPILLSRHSEPEPDLAILKPKEEIYEARHPRPDEVLLVIEIADTTLDYDQQVKALLYAKEGIQEYWIVNLEEESLEVYRQPGPDGYAETMTLQRGDEVEILALPAAGVFSVEEILGP